MLVSSLSSHRKVALNYAERLLRGRLSSCGGFRGVSRGSNPCTHQCLVEGRAHLIGRQRAVNFLAVHENRRRGTHPKGVGFFHGSFHLVLVLRLDASLQLACVE